MTSSNLPFRAAKVRLFRMQCYTVSTKTTLVRLGAKTPTAHIYIYKSDTLHNTESVNL